jgi:hypothetical protein
MIKRRMKPYQTYLPNFPSHSKPTLGGWLPRLAPSLMEDRTSTWFQRETSAFLHWMEHEHKTAQVGPKSSRLNKLTT